jgi:anti-sigma B factor antagonist
VAEGSQFRAVVERPSGEATVVHASGELDLRTVAQLEAALADADGSSRLELDLGRLGFIDSTGVRLVLATYDACRRDGRDFLITAASPEVTRAFELLGLLDHLPFRDPGRSAS